MAAAGTHAGTPTSASTHTDTHTHMRACTTANAQEGCKPLLAVSSGLRRLPASLSRDYTTPRDPPIEKASPRAGCAFRE
eukprot:5513675-Alexandrium_andersonii.AAC.1